MKTAIILAALLIAVSSSFAYAVQCKNFGKTWRLVDGKRCWADRHYSKSVLHWGSAQPTVRIMLRRPKRAASRPIEHRLPDKEVTSTAPEPESIPKNAIVASDLGSALERAEELHQVDVQEFRPVRTVLASPIPSPPLDIIPFPQPRPRIEPPPPLIQPQWALLLAMLLIGNAASEGRDD
jgi:hypothetical protein